MSSPKYDETRKVQKPPLEDVLSVKRKRAWLPAPEGDVPCDVCGLLCPLNLYEGFETIHITCSYGVSGKRWVKERAKRLKAAMLAGNSLGI
jgi:hypothetical protein